MTWYSRDKDRRELAASLRVAGQIVLFLAAVAAVAFLTH